MKVSLLDPVPTDEVPFRRDQCRHVPDTAGCYALVTIVGTVLYVGLGRNLRNRMGQHIDNKQKTEPCADGRACRFFWYSTSNLEQVERTWMNIHLAARGCLPIMNKAYSPTAV